MRQSIPFRLRLRELRGDSPFFFVPPALETPHLLLRPMRLRDAEDIFAYSSDPQVARYVLWEPHREIAETRAYIRAMRRLYRRGAPSSWAIELRPERKVIGSIGLMWISPENRSAEIGYSLSRAYWRHGLATEALARVIRFSFEELRLHRLEAQYDTRNPASGRVMEKCGMRQEGILRDRIFNKGEYVDVALCAILEESFLEDSDHFV